MTATKQTDNSAVHASAVSGWRLRAMRCSERVIALAIAFLLLRSSFAHLGNPYFFLSTVYSYKLAGIETGLLISVLLPFLQLTIAACLISRWWTFEGYITSTVMFFSFFLIQLSAMSRGLDIACGCFGSASIKVGIESLCLAFAGSAGGVIGVCLFRQVELGPK